jgi:hypothetical protein
LYFCVLENGIADRCEQSYSCDPDGQEYSIYISWRLNHLILGILNLLTGPG